MGPGAAGVMAGGQIWSSINQYQAQTAEQKQQDAETRRLNEEARQARDVAGFKQVREAEAGDRQLSSMEASAAAGGTVSTSGAPLMALAKQAAENTLKNLTIGWQGIEESHELKYEAAQSKYKARLMAQSKRNALYTGLMGAGGTALTGFSKMGGENPNISGGGAIGGADPSYVASPDFESLSGQYGTFM